MNFYSHGRIVVMTWSRLCDTSSIRQSPVCSDYFGVLYFSHQMRQDLRNSVQLSETMITGILQINESQKL
jgi:hypothetical protein